jgi:hypothetical protein
LLNQRLTFAKSVAAELFPAEADLETAIVHASRLAIALIEGRKTAKLPITAGQEGLELMSKATAKLVEARGDIGAAHAAFRVAQNDIGLRTVSFGDIYECPDSNSAELAPHLASVA